MPRTAQVIIPLWALTAAIDRMGFRRVKASNAKTLDCKLKKISNVNTVLAKNTEVTRPDLPNRRWNHRCSSQWILKTKP
jgi:hypothetical protein